MFATRRAFFVGLALVSVSNLAHAEGLPPWFRAFADSVTAQFQQQDALITENAANMMRLQDELRTLKDQLQVYDYRNYVGNTITSRTYAMQGNGVCGTMERLTFARQGLPDGTTQVLQTRERRTAVNTLCQYDVFDYRASDSAMSLAGREGHSIIDPTIVTNTNVLETPVPVRTSTMRIGASWGSASLSTQTVPATGAVNIGSFMQINTLLGVEPVTVPAGTFNDCLKIMERRDSTHIGNYIYQTSWYCRDIGLTKRVAANSGGTLPIIQELVSFTTN